MVVTVMSRLISHCKKWNCWRKYNDNTGFHKLLVLFKIVKSPTFDITVDGKILVANFNASVAGVNLAKKSYIVNTNENDSRKEKRNVK